MNPRVSVTNATSGFVITIDDTSIDHVQLVIESWNNERCAKTQQRVQMVNGVGSVEHFGWKPRVLMPFAILLPSGIELRGMMN